MLNPIHLKRILWRRFDYWGGKKWRATVKRLHRMCREAARKRRQRAV
jgi:hypothetical protein